MLRLNQKFAQSGNRPSGFDYMRILLAIGIIAIHSVEICYGIETRNKILLEIRPLVAIILPMFFSLSGFLVAGSMERTNGLRQFLYFRILRIFPALSVETALSALILGPILTFLPLENYFSHPDFQQYFGNMLGFIHYLLPGVFESNPVPRTVNAQLWTVPYELWCYAVVLFIYCLNFPNHFNWVGVTLFGYVIVLTSTDFEFHERLICVNGSTLVLAFLCGATLYHLRNAIVYNAGCFWAAAFMCFFLLFFPKYDVFVAIPVAYITVYMGMMNPTRSWVINSGDYSYGIFLYGYAIQQAIATQPTLRLYPVHFALSLLIAFVFAYFSWHLVEKRVLALKKTRLPVTKFVS